MEVLSTLRYEGKCNVNIRGTNGMTALMWAAYWEDLEMLEWLIDEGAEINEQENFGQTALTLCAESLKFKSMMYLLNWDLEAHVARKEEEAFLAAESLAREEEERESRRKAKKKLLKLGASADQAALAAIEKKEKAAADKTAANASKKAPPSRDSLMAKRKEKSKKKNAKFDKTIITRWPRMLGYYKEQQVTDYTPLTIPLADFDAPPKPSEECNPNIPTLNDATALVILCRKCLAINKAQLEPAIDLLYKKGARINQKTSDGMSAIMWAVLNDSLPVAKQLLVLGADPNITDALGISLLDNCKSGAMRMTVKAAIDAAATAMKEQAANEDM
jgi:hypothetical protein